MKIAVIGGGSTYTPELVDGLARLRSLLPVDELCLMDVAADRLALIGPLAERMFRREGHPGKVTWTSDVVAAVADADFVLIQLRIGGQAARLVDETFPLPCGCLGQETTGAGGLAKALRTVPRVLEIAEQVRRHAKSTAWIIDFTNPVGIVTRALLDAGHRAVGLCNVAIGFQRKFAAALDVSPDRVSLDHVGLNHLSWERQIRLDGVDVLPRLLEERSEELAEETRIPARVLRELGVVPSYYLHYYYQHDEVVEQLRVSTPRAQIVADVERELLAVYADPQLDTKPAQLELRGGAYYSEAAVDVMASLWSDRGDVQVVNLRNNGLFPSLSDDAVVEVPATVSAAGVVPVSTAPLEPLFSGLVSHASAYEELAIDAAIHGGRERVFRALLANPLVGQIGQADYLTDELISLNAAHLDWAQ
ncbi:MAG TPA: 6-phospho-beta-glucosidase [Lacisediminihabitans sp.]|uniref:6-phospho-beta-glucosidase n=1 Tax=Lacisediminihabitans sp. TaxID=2787631 RepID=UPI002ED931BB